MYLEPNWSQPRPTWEETRSMCCRLQLQQVETPLAIFADVIKRLREARTHGGAFLACFQMGNDETFHWFASRNRLTEDGILEAILSRPEVRQALPALAIADEPSRSAPGQTCCSADSNCFKFDSPFLFDAHLAQQLYMGGAYWSQRGDGAFEKKLALDFCNAAFELRFAEMLYCLSWEAWTPWFHGIAWDWTSVLFDRRLSKLWILAVTDTD